MRASALALLTVLATASTAGAAVRVDGRGFGHGVGLAQYGAMGYALKEGRGFRWILAHYYPTTHLVRGPSARMRVRLKEEGALRVAGATTLRASDGRVVGVRSTHTVRFTWWSPGVLRAFDLASGRGIGHLRTPVRITGAAPLRLLGLAENGVRDGRYRGALVMRLDGERVLAIDDVDLEQYLGGVVTSEMPSYWPAQALDAQAVAARTYALFSRRPAETFDVYADTRSQQYDGVAGETAAALAAVRATAKLVLHTAGGATADALFSASSGGRTAAVEEAFPVPPVSYLRSVDDPWDSLSPFHTWIVRFSDAEASRRLLPVLPGELVDVTVLTRSASGRAQTVRVTGTLGTQDVGAQLIRTLLGLRSTWFTIVHTS
jgi:stage II sporulation protein D